MNKQRKAARNVMDVAKAITCTNKGKQCIKEITSTETATQRGNNNIPAQQSYRNNNKARQQQHHGNHRENISEHIAPNRAIAKMVLEKTGCL